jgi:hypothetical protein
MRKFLKLIDESKPGSNSEYVISVSGPANLEDIYISGDEYTFDLHEKIKAIVEGRADVVIHDEQPVEDQEDSEMLDREFEDEAETEPKYAEALKDRKRVLDNKLMDYKKQTQELKTS